MMMKREYESQVRQAEKQMAELDAQEAELKKRQSHLQVDQLGEATRIRRELDEIQGRRSDLKLLRDIAQEQLDKWQKGMAKAKPLIEDGGAAHKRGREIFVKLAKHQEGVRDLVKDLDEVNVTMSTRAKEFEDLTGESMDLTLSMICYPAMAFAAAETIKPYDPWTYRSEIESKAEHQRMETERFKQYQDRLAIANQLAPPCVRCGQKTVVNTHAGRKEEPGAGIHDGHWSFYCKACGNGQDGVVPETKTKK
jgi:hypothetical protein